MLVDPKRIRRRPGLPYFRASFKKLLVVLLVALFVGGTTAGCSASNEDGERIGKVVGATAGILIASRASKDSDPATHAAMTALGAYLGAWIGGEIGKEITRLDQIYAERALEESLDNSKNGDTVVWSNPDSGHSGSATPVSTAADSDCRDFATTVIIDGKEEETTGRACKQADGTWKIVSGDTTS